MKASNQIRSALGNIGYYCRQIESLAREQFEHDVTVGNQIGVDEKTFSEYSSIIGFIGETTEYITTYCENIENHLSAAEELESRIFGKGEGNGRGA